MRIVQYRLVVYIVMAGLFFQLDAANKHDYIRRPMVKRLEVDSAFIDNTAHYIVHLTTKSRKNPQGNTWTRSGVIHDVSLEKLERLTLEDEAAIYKWAINKAASQQGWRIASQGPEIVIRRAHELRVAPCRKVAQMCAIL